MGASQQKLTESGVFTQRRGLSIEAIKPKPSDYKDVFING
jgi:hypothetical protein